MYESVPAYSLMAQNLNHAHFEMLESTSINNRSMKKRNSVLFERLKSFATESDYGPQFHKAICISNDDRSKEWLKKLSSDSDVESVNSFDVFKVNNFFKITQFYFENCKYLVITGLDSLSLDSNGFELIEMNSGIFTLFASIDFINIKDVSNNIGSMYDLFLYHSEDTKSDIRYVSLNDIIDFYKSAFVFKFLDSSVYFDLDLARLSSYIALEKYKDYFYYLNDDSLFDLLRDLIINGEPALNFNYLSKSICIKDEPYMLFMDLYRMLERVYSLPTIKALKDELLIQVDDSWKILKLLEKRTGWRKKEGEGLHSLLSLLEEDQLCDIYEILKRCHGCYFNDDNVSLKGSLYRLAKEKPDASADGVVRLQREWLESLRVCVRDYIYSTRNSYVHYREILEPHLDRDQILSLCQVLLLAINPIYVKVSN